MTYHFLEHNKIWALVAMNNNTSVYHPLKYVSFVLDTCHVCFRKWKQFYI